MTREGASLMQTPHGDFVCLYHGADSLQEALQMLVGSEEPYDVSPRENAVNIDGITPEMMSKAAALAVFDWPGH